MEQDKESDTDYNKQPERFYYDEHVDVINPNQGTVLDAKITSIRGNIYIIRYTESKQEEHINIQDNLILKQWCPGREFLRFNRLDIQEPNTSTWNEGIILNIDKDNNKLQVRYQLKKTSEIYEELLPKDSNRIAPAGKYTGKYYYASKYSSEEINTKLFSKRKFCKLNQIQEKKFKEQMQQIHFAIKLVKGDGNCLFRAISDQIYGSENAHEVLRAKCMDYIEVEKEFFSQFIDCDFADYVEMKRTSGVWGDDIELQALSELYNRPIEIYSHSIQPLKTFHENSSEFNRIEHLNEDKDKDNSKDNNNAHHYPIRLSYHGKAHYNSIIPNDENNLPIYKDALLINKPGELEDMMIEKLKTYNKNKQNEEGEMSQSNKVNINNTIEETLTNNNNTKQELGRNHFKEKNKEFIDELLLESLSKEINENEDLVDKEKDIIINTTITTTNNNNDDMKKAMIQSELEDNEKELFESAIKMSLENKDKETNKGNDTCDVDYYSIHAIQQALEFGFSLNDAILAYSIYGDSPDLILQYLYSMNTYN